MNNLDVGLHYVTATVDNIQSEYTLAHDWAMVCYILAMSIMHMVEHIQCQNSKINSR